MCWTTWGLLIFECFGVQRGACWEDGGLPGLRLAFFECF